MPDKNKPGSGVVPSARAERKRMLSDDTLGLVVYAAALAVISSVILAIVALT
jgi:hypothetical protein